MKKPRNEYENALRLCEQVAREEHRYAAGVLQGALESVDALRKDLNHASIPGLGRTRVSDDTREQIRALERQLDSSSADALKLAQSSLAKKAKRLSKFTVTLFGPTMAGKSTIREAITRGDGGTIGKGAQRTTRDVREYDWNQLRIVDTPGIGAYKGEGDRDLALSRVDQSDVLLFLVSSDGIQETAFRGMKAIRSQNKPIIFVLNVKRDLERKVFLKQFLRNPQSLIGADVIGGHVNRIKKLASDELGMRNVKIVPVHAQAAFLATRQQDAKVARQIHDASGIDNLLSLLTTEVRYRGPVRRLQTFLDGTTNQLLDLEELLLGQAKVLDRSAHYLRSKFGELDVWLDGYIGSVNERIQDDAKSLFKPLRSSVSTFIDDNIERSDVGIRWKKRVDSIGIDAWMSSMQQQLHDEVRARLQDFHREIDLESELAAAFRMTGPTQYDPLDVKRTLRWASAGGAALAGIAAIAAWIGGANFWNPVGWVAGAVGVVALGLSWLFGDREQQLQRQKVKAARQLRNQIDEMERRVANHVKTWFYKNITSSLVRRIRTDTRTLYGEMFSIAKSLRKAALQLRQNVGNLNRRLLVRTSQLLETEQPRLEAMARIARDPGLRTKILWNQEYPCSRFSKDVGLALGEWIDGVPPGTRLEQIAAALVPGRIEPKMVSLNGSRYAIVKAPQQEVGRAIGKAGHNVSLASQLLDLQIRIQTGERK